MREPLGRFLLLGCLLRCRGAHSAADWRNPTPVAPSPSSTDLGGGRADRRADTRRRTAAVPGVGTKHRRRESRRRGTQHRRDRGQGGACRRLHAAVLRDRLCHQPAASLCTQGKLPYDARRPSLIPVAGYAGSRCPFDANPSLTAKTVAERSRWRRRKPGGITYGTAGLGTALTRAHCCWKASPASR